MRAVEWMEGDWLMRRSQVREPEDLRIGHPTDTLPTPRPLSQSNYGKITKRTSTPSYFAHRATPTAIIKPSQAIACPRPTPVQIQKPPRLPILNMEKTNAEACTDALSLPLFYFSCKIIIIIRSCCHPMWRQQWQSFTMPPSLLSLKILHLNIPASGRCKINPPISSSLHFSMNTFMKVPSEF
jgi:hypothetical protein